MNRLFARGAKYLVGAVLGSLIILSVSFAWVCVSPDAAYAKRRSVFTIFVGKDRRAVIVNLLTKLAPADTYMMDGSLCVTLNSPNAYDLAKFSNGSKYYLDRNYVLTNIPGTRNRAVWIKGRDADLLNTSNTFIQFTISDTARVYVYYDANAASLPAWLSSKFTLRSQQLLTNDPAVPVMKEYRATITKGVVRLGGNEGGTTGAKCNYVVAVREATAGDEGSSEQIATTEMALPRMGHRVVTLDNGKVLVAGGVDTNATLVTACELYDSTAQSYTATGTLLEGRINPTLVKLNDGRVMLIGGDLGGQATIGSGALAATGINALASCEIYDPATGTWSATGSMGWRRRLPEAIKLADGRVFVSGGVNDTNGLGIPTTEIYNPATGMWSAGPDMTSMGPYNDGSGYGGMVPGMRYGHRMALLPDGRVLIAGGVWHGPDLIDYAMSACEVFDPAAGTMTVTGSMTAPRGRFGLVDIGAGKFLAAGGLVYQNPLDAPGAYMSTSEVDVYDASTGVWTRVASLPRGMYDFAVVSPDAGRAMIFDGYDVQATEAGDVLLYDANLDNWTQVGTLTLSRSFPFSNGAQMVADVGGKDYFLTGGTHYDEASGQTTLLCSGERFKY